MREEITGTVPQMIDKGTRMIVPQMIEQGVQKTVPKMIEEGIQKTVPQMIENGIKKTVPQMIEKALKPIKRDIKSLKRGQDIIISFFDRDSLELRSRVDRIERHLKLPSN